MLVDFKSLNKNSRVWVFQSVTLIDDYIVEIIKDKLTLFLCEWKSHQRDFKSSFEIRYNTFIIIAADEGNLVSDDILNSIVSSRLINDVKNGFILDGYPRTLNQSEFLKDLI